MKLYTKHSKQNLPITIDEAWDFLSNPKNLKTITPEYMGFIIESGADRPMFPGQIIQYIVTPLFGIKTKWVTEITHITEGSYFVDEQRSGPYAMWHHRHFVEPEGDGTLMTDIVTYRPPLGILGRIANSLFIRKKLGQIFDYRERVMNSLSGKL